MKDPNNILGSIPTPSYVSDIVKKISRQESVDNLWEPPDPPSERVRGGIIPISKIKVYVKLYRQGENKNNDASDSFISSCTASNKISLKFIEHLNDSVINDDWLDDDNNAEVLDLKARFRSLNKSPTYSFDYVFSPGSIKTENAFHILKDIIPDFFDGKSSTIVVSGTSDQEILDSLIGRFGAHETGLLTGAIYLTSKVIDSIGYKKESELPHFELTFSKSLIPLAQSNTNEIVAPIQFSIVLNHRASSLLVDTLKNEYLTHSNHSRTNHQLYVISLKRFYLADKTNNSKIYSRINVLCLANNQSYDKYLRPNGRDIKRYLELRDVIYSLLDLPRDDSYHNQDFRNYDQIKNSAINIISHVNNTQDEYVYNHLILKMLSDIYTNKESKQIRYFNKMGSPLLKEKSNKRYPFHHYFDDFNSSTEESYPTVIYLSKNSRKYHADNYDNLDKLLPIQLNKSKNNIYLTNREKNQNVRPGLLVEGNKKYFSHDSLESNGSETYYYNNKVIIKPGKAPLRDISSRKKFVKDKPLHCLSSTPPPRNKKYSFKVDGSFDRGQMYSSLNRKHVKMRESKHFTRPHQESVERKQLDNINGFMDIIKDSNELQGPFKLSTAPNLKETWIDGPYSPDFLKNIQNKVAMNKNSNINSFPVNESNNTFVAKVCELTDNPSIGQRRTSKLKKFTSTNCDSLLQVISRSNMILPNVTSSLDTQNLMLKHSNKTDLEINIKELQVIGDELNNIFKKHEDLENVFMSESAEDTMTDFNLSFVDIPYLSESLNLKNNHDNVKFSFTKPCLYSQPQKHLTSETLRTTSHSISISELSAKHKPVMKVDPFVTSTYCHMGKRHDNSTKESADIHNSTWVKGENIGRSNIFVENDIYANNRHRDKKIYLNNSMTDISYTTKTPTQNYLKTRYYGLDDQHLTERPQCSNNPQFHCYNFNFLLGGQSQKLALPHRDIASTKNQSSLKLNFKFKGEESVNRNQLSTNCLTHSLSCSCFNNLLGLHLTADNPSRDDTTLMITSNKYKPTDIENANHFLIEPPNNFESNLSREDSLRSLFNFYEKEKTTSSLNYEHISEMVTAHNLPKVNSRENGSSGYESSPNRTNVTEYEVCAGETEDKYSLLGTDKSSPAYDEIREQIHPIHHHYESIDKIKNRKMMNKNKNLKGQPITVEVISKNNGGGINDVMHRPVLKDGATSPYIKSSWAKLFCC
ncbi:unnamed protein product [Gordionus sp. m RMFG-2023]|uniref:uncharacterized protein LOC135923716 n=1 Tax=Gordionus sp. m RMFG-2023 TaxID=3053472 RepID=UPI0030E0908F